MKQCILPGLETLRAMLALRFSVSLIFMLLTVNLAAAEPVPVAADDAGAEQWFEQVDVAVRDWLTALAEEAASKGDDLKWTFSAPDRRLRFPVCSQTPAVSSRSPADSGQITLQVSCEGERDWQIHVRAHLERWVEVMVLRNAVARKQTLQAADIEIRRLNTDSLRYGYYRKDAALSGMTARRSLAPGYVLHPAVLDAPRAIRRGDRVQITASNQAIMVRMQGTALSDGRIGEQITVENESSGRRVRAVVTGANRVEIEL